MGLRSVYYGDIFKAIRPLKTIFRVLALIPQIFGLNSLVHDQLWPGEYFLFFEVFHSDIIYSIAARAITR